MSNNLLLIITAQTTTYSTKMDKTTANLRHSKITYQEVSNHDRANGDNLSPISPEDVYSQQYPLLGRDKAIKTPSKLESQMTTPPTRTLTQNSKQISSKNSISQRIFPLARNM